MMPEIPVRANGTYACRSRHRWHHGDMVDRVVAGEREHRYDSDRTYVFDLLTRRRSEWIQLHPGEVLPAVVASESDSVVIWSSFWPVSPNDTVEITLSSDRVNGPTTLRYRWLTESPPDERGIAITNQRLNTRFGGDIRGWIGRYES